jgi:hypothetical protein
MLLVSVTRLRLISFLFWLPLVWKTWSILRQVRRAPGFVAGELLTDRKLTFWTMTLWNNQESMRKFMSSGAHYRVIPKLFTWCNEASSVHWEQESLELPNWIEAYQHMIQKGREVPVKKRSPFFSIRKIAAPRISKLFLQSIKKSG